MTNRKFKIIFFIIFFMISITQGFAQSELFRVIAVYGEAFVKDLKSNEWNKLSFGKKLNSYDIIKLGKNVYLGLVYKSGKTIELKNIGIYKVKDLTNNLKQPNSTSMTYKFADFIFNEVSQKDSEGKVMDEKGAVMRERIEKDKIKLYMPRNSNIIDTTIIFSWYKYGENAMYYFSLLDKFDRLIYETETSDTLIKLNVINLNLLEDNHYYWSVALNKEKNTISREYWFYIEQKENSKMIKDSVQQILAENNFEETIACKFILANFYEQHKIYDKALKLYREVNSKEPEVEQYHFAYKSMLDRLGIEE